MNELLNLLNVER